MARITFDFQIPVTLQSEKLGVKVVSLRQLTSEQEITAQRLGRFDMLKTQYEAVKMAMAEFDGKAANFSNGDVDQFWEDAGPKLRSLLLQGYNKISSPDGEEEKSFFGSMKTRAQ